ncbi:MAG: ATP-binding cassette domain-containing protein [Patescibacteria group bacterium]|nr:ATP-binding cassette domain-containing protein [Patescibacteria group bacterium]
MIKVENISKSFGFVKAIDDLSFEVKTGEILGFLGPNGAGKTTTMRILTGFLAPDQGKVTIENVSVTDNPTDAQKFIGYLPENNPLYGEMQVKEILSLAADLQDIPKSERKDAFDFVVKSAGIESVFYRPVGELSKGYKQRVGIATALIHKPKIIIMDEPTEGLDPNQRTEIRKLIKKLAEKHTVIMSTHVMQEASAVCNRMLIINKGKIVADGTADEISQASNNESVLEVEIEGRNVEKTLRDIENILEVKIEADQSGKFSATLVHKPEISLQPKISSLAKSNDWTIWKINQKEHDLEDIFQQLTK